MKTKIISIGIFAMLIANFGVAQATYEGNNNSAPPNSFLGWDNSVTDPLEIEHEGDFPIIFRTNSTERMRIMSYGNVGVGVTATPYKFESRLTNANIAPPGFGRSTAIYGRCDLTEMFQWNYGIEGIAQGVNIDEGDDNIGGRFYAQQAWRNIAVDAVVGSVIQPATSTVGELRASGFGLRKITTG